MKAKEVLQAETEASWFAPHSLGLIATSLELCFDQAVAECETTSHSVAQSSIAPSMNDDESDNRKQEWAMLK